MAVKRKGGSLRDGQIGGGNKRRKPFQRGQLSGPGILLTTIRRKERKAGLELIEFLDDLVKELYPNLDLSIPEPTRGNTEGERHEYDDDLDELKNGIPTKSIASQVSSSAISLQPDSTPIKVASKAVPEDDIEAQIKAELEEIRPNRQQDHKTYTNGKQTSEEKNEDDLKSEVVVRKKFTLIDPEVECLMFVSVAWPMDPVQLCCALLEKVEKTGQVRGHFIQRLSPIYLTGRADGIERIENLARKVMETHYPESSEPITFKVEPKIRLHNQLHKMDIIKAVATNVPAPHQANINNPKLIINVEVLKMTIGIGILPRYEEFKRYNPQMIAQKFNQDHNKIDELASRTLLSPSSIPLVPQIQAK